MASSRSGEQRGILLGTTLASLEALTDTCYVNLRADQQCDPFHGFNEGLTPTISIGDILEPTRSF